MNKLRNKTTWELITITAISLFMLILFPSLLTMVPEKIDQIKPSLTDNPLDNNQLPTMPTDTGTHPVNSSPASTNISDKK
uniref:Female-specific orf protein n=1 Tax=Cyclonaias pustulosa TaxID=2202230 RepID=F4ZFL6_CYCPS|nr:female-specific orf protein [Pustulosa pustulosa]AEC14100.1 female-specific orf protein [Pustulosa pustulosa]